MNMKKKRLMRIILVSVLALLLGIPLGVLAFYGVRQHRPRVIKLLPDPFIFLNGTRVENEGDWMERRTEILDLLQDYEYGHSPERPDAIRTHIIANTSWENGVTEIHAVLEIVPSNSTPMLTINMSVWIFIPEGEGPFPTLMKVGEDGCGTEDLVNSTIVARDFLYVCYNHTNLDLDTEGSDIIGPAQTAYPSYDWGSIAVWAWGASRVVDFLVCEPWVERSEVIIPADPEKIIITGHSRRGKTAAVAGAYDDRFAIVVPNGSGCGGMGSFLVQGPYSETIGWMVSDRWYYSWFSPNFRQFASNERELSFDQHFLRACVAPRLILSTDGQGDWWANPQGTQSIYSATQPIFDFLDVSDHNAIHYRKGGHGYLIEDFTIVMNFAEKMFYNRTTEGNFNVIPYHLPLYFEYTSP